MTTFFFLSLSLAFQRRRRPKEFFAMSFLFSIPSRRIVASDKLAGASTGSWSMSHKSRNSSREKSSKGTLRLRAILWRTKHATVTLNERGKLAWGLREVDRENTINNTMRPSSGSIAFQDADKETFSSQCQKPAQSWNELSCEPSRTFPVNKIVL